MLSGAAVTVVTNLVSTMSEHLPELNVDPPLRWRDVGPDSVILFFHVEIFGLLMASFI